MKEDKKASVSLQLLEIRGYSGRSSKGRKFREQGVTLI